METEYKMIAKGAEEGFNKLRPRKVQSIPLQSRLLNKHPLSIHSSSALFLDIPTPPIPLGLWMQTALGQLSPSRTRYTPPSTINSQPPIITYNPPPFPARPARAHSHIPTPQRSWPPRSPPAADEGPRLGLRAGRAESRCRRLQHCRCSSRRPAPRNCHCLSRKHQILRPQCPAKRVAAAGPPSYGERPPLASSLRTAPVAGAAGRLESRSQHASLVGLVAPFQGVGLEAGLAPCGTLRASRIASNSAVRGRGMVPDFPWVGPRARGAVLPQLPPAPFPAILGFANG